MSGTTPDPTGSLFGAGVTIGTLPDLGFTFKGRGRVVVAVPDVAVRVALEADLFEIGPSMKGVLVVDRSGVFVGVEGQLRFPQDGFCLYDVRLPVEAWFPKSDPQWHIYAGSDGVGDRSSPGPIRMSVLPDLFGIKCEAFLMVSGHGLENVANRLPKLNGFAIAAGFHFSTTYGPKPVVWIDIDLAAAVGIGTAPLVVAGTATVGGSLHLGPFSLGLDATLDLQIGPGPDLWAHLEACGSIDLFFTEIRGCVHVDLGSPTIPDPLDPPSPLRTARASASLEVLDASAGDLGTTADSAPVVWPDVHLLLGFAPGPKPTLGASPFLPDVKAGCPDGRGGCDAAYMETYELTKLDLRAVSGEGTGAGHPAGSVLPAAWQLVGTPSSTMGAARTLALLTRDHALMGAHHGIALRRVGGDRQSVRPREKRLLGVVGARSGLGVRRSRDLAGTGEPPPPSCVHVVEPARFESGSKHPHVRTVGDRGPGRRDVVGAPAAGGDTGPRPRRRDDTCASARRQRGPGLAASSHPPALYRRPSGGGANRNPVRRRARSRRRPPRSLPPSCCCWTRRRGNASLRSTGTSESNLGPTARCSWC